MQKIAWYLQVNTPNVVTFSCFVFLFLTFNINNNFLQTLKSYGTSNVSPDICVEHRHIKCMTQWKLLCVWTNRVNTTSLDDYDDYNEICQPATTFIESGTGQNMCG